MQTMNDEDLRGEVEVIDGRDDPSWDGMNELEALALQVDVIDQREDDPDDHRIINRVFVSMTDIANALSEVGYCLHKKDGEPWGKA